MNVNFFQEDNGTMSHYSHAQRLPVKKYGFFRFLRDCLLTLITGGLWLIWIFVREMRRR